MKRFKVTMAYAGSIVREVEAEDENDAIAKIRADIAELSNDDYIEQCDFQENGSEVEELPRKFNVHWTADGITTVHATDEGSAGFKVNGMTQEELLTLY